MPREGGPLDEQRPRDRLVRVGTAGGEPILVLGGLGAAMILAPEAGLHVLELPRSAGAGARATVAVVFAPRTPEMTVAGDAMAAAQSALGAQPAVSTVSRRYRQEPSPLVRDSARGYRTGRLDRVLTGEDGPLFDRP